MGKYIASIYDEPYTSSVGENIYRMVNSTKTFTATELATLFTPYTEPDTSEAYQRGYDDAKHKCNIQAEKDLREVGERHYQKGLSDAWEAARKICLNESDGGLSGITIRNIFNTEHYRDALRDNTPAKAIEKIRQYEQEQIQVGDEVKVFERKPFIVTGFGYGDDDVVYCHGFVTENGISTSAKKDECVKTGRSFPEIAEVMRKMKESQ